MCYHNCMSELIVVDTSVLISALIGEHGPGREVIRQCLLGEYKPLISNALFQEYEDVSKRAKILDLCPLTKSEIKELLNAFYSVCIWTPIYYLWRPNVIDEGDNFLLELAVKSNSIIVTLNGKDFKKSSEFGIKVMTPKEFLIYIGEIKCKQ